jgi:hypothetical protein
VHGSHDVSRRIDPLLDSHDQFLWDERFGTFDPRDVALILHRETVGPLGPPPDQRRVLEAFGYQHPELGTLSFDQPVHGQRRGVADDFGLGEERADLQVESRGRLGDCLVHAHRQVVGRRPRLAPDRPIAERHVAVGERPPDVDIDGCPHGLDPFTPYLRCSAPTSSSMSKVKGCPGGRYSVSISVPQPGQ